MVHFEKLYRTENFTVTRITAEYDTSYTENDYNKYNSISFPISSCFSYKTGNKSFLLDSCSVLLGKAGTEFAVSKFKEFTKDITLDISFTGEENEINALMEKISSPAALQKRNVKMEIALRRLLQTNNLSFVEKEDAEQNIIDIINYVLFGGFYTNSEIKIRPYILKNIERAKEFILTHYLENITINDIAIEAYMSVFHFSRIFRSITGYSPYHYLMRTRIENARIMLTNGCSVTQAAFECGFNGLENFSAAFSRIEGRNPSHFKNSRI